METSLRIETKTRDKLKDWCRIRNKTYDEAILSLLEDASSEEDVLKDKLLGLNMEIDRVETRLFEIQDRKPQIIINTI